MSDTGTTRGTAWERPVRTVARVIATYLPTEETKMPLFMDVHHEIPDDADADAVADAHRADLRVQAKYDTRYLNYWLDERQRRIFCLVEAPDAETAHAVHREAHGLVADEIYQVEQG